MPIMIQAVSKDDFGKWVEEAKEEFARVEGAEAPLRLADANGEKTTD